MITERFPDNEPQRSAARHGADTKTGLALPMQVRTQIAVVSFIGRNRASLCE
jgi:hypothetical protein